jgi:hypothetical protein
VIFSTQAGGALEQDAFASRTHRHIRTATTTEQSDPGEHITDGRREPLAAASRRDASVIESACNGPFLPFTTFFPAVLFATYDACPHATFLKIFIEIPKA